MDNLKKIAKEFVESNNLLTEELTVCKIKEIIEFYGFTIYEYNNEYNPKTGAILDSINATEYSKHTNSFTYYDKGHKMLFIREGLGKEDQLALLLHECCHICLDHPAVGITINNTGVKQEHDANRLSELILKRINANQKIRSVKEALFPVSVAILAMTVIIAASLKTDNRYNDDPIVPSKPPVSVGSEIDSASDIAGSDLQSSQTDSSAPGSQAEDLAPAELVYWTSDGDVYHLFDDCQHLKNSTNIKSGTAEESSKDRCCKTCESRWALEEAK